MRIVSFFLIKLFKCIKTSPIYECFDNCWTRWSTFAVAFLNLSNCYFSIIHTFNWFGIFHLSYGFVLYFSELSKKKCIKHSDFVELVDKLLRDDWPKDLAFPCSFLALIAFMAVHRASFTYITFTLSGKEYHIYEVISSIRNWLANQKENTKS